MLHEGKTHENGVKGGDTRKNSYDCILSCERIHTIAYSHAKEFIRLHTLMRKNSYDCILSCSKQVYKHTPI